MKLLEEGRDRVPGFIDVACDALGCVDPRTARKHVRHVHAAVKAKLPAIAALLAATPGPSEGQAFLPDTNPFAILNQLWDKFLKSAQERSGTIVARSFGPLLWLGPGFESWGFSNRSCIPITQPP